MKHQIDNCHHVKWGTCHHVNGVLVTMLMGYWSPCQWGTCHHVNGVLVTIVNGVLVTMSKGSMSNEIDQGEKNV